MSVAWPEQQRRQRAHLCIWCAEPAQYLPNLERHGVHCAKHARVIAENAKRWRERKR
jgi:hypothetical protein